MGEKRIVRRSEGRESTGTEEGRGEREREWRCTGRGVCSTTGIQLRTQQRPFSNRY